jgi:poly-gamma-glutamate capsule biosynthesis protein CapA/YwtB (metallophosphatase superfamily)
MRHGFFLLVIFFIALVGFSFAFSPTLSKTQKPKEFSIGWVGDMVPSGQEAWNHGAFGLIKSETQKPDLMIGNFEATFAKEDRASKCLYLGENCHAFRGDESFAYALKDAGFDFISLVNNHSYDYGDEGLYDTEKVLENFDIPFISQTKPSISIVVNDKRIGILGVSFTPPKKTINDYDFIYYEITKLKQKNDIVILIFHGGSEGSDKTFVTGDFEYLGDENRGNVEKTSKIAIDAGADMVLGSGPHVLRKVEYYKGKPIIYSAGNFVGGNQRLQTKGALGISAIFNIKKIDSSFRVNITSVLLSKEGVPEIDPLNQGKELIEKISD